MPTTPKFLSREGRILPGVKRVVQVVSPGVGLDWSTPVPAGKQWRVLSINATYAASVAAANRFPRIQGTDGNNRLFEISSNIAVTAGPVYHISAWREAPQIVNTGNGTYLYMPIPDLWIPGGGAVLTQTSAIDVADQWSAINLYVEEAWFDDPSLTDWYDVVLDAATRQQGGR